MKKFLVSICVLALGLLAACDSEYAYAEWQNSADIGLKYATGNLDKVDVGIGYSSLYVNATEGIEFKGIALYDMARLDNSDKKERIRAGANLDWIGLGKYDSFIFLNYEKKAYTGIDDRVGLGYGCKYKFLTTPNKKIDISAAVLLWSDKNDSEAALSYRGRAVIKPNDALEFGVTAFYQPKIVNWDFSPHYLASMDANCQIKLMRGIALKLSLIDEYDSIPAKNIGYNDLEFKTGLNFKL